MAYLVSKKYFVGRELFFLYVSVIISKSKCVTNFKDGCLKKDSVLGGCSAGRTQTQHNLPLVHTSVLFF